MKSEGYTITVTGLPPAAQPRARALPKGRGVYVPKDGKIGAWKKHVVATVMAYDWWQAAPFTGPLRVACCFFFPRPKYMTGAKWLNEPLPYVARPDRDNLDKAVLDCLTAGKASRWDSMHAGLWKDDSLVCQGPVEKWYAAKGQEPGAIIHVRAASSWADRYGDWRPWEQ